ncbi:MAG: hypothetical protein LKE40_04205 [Spirochaetia bacterium]|nr:hypothetical protein [Spirochaetia bacterium]
MLQDTRIIRASLKDYKSPKSKMTQMVKHGDLVQIRRGLFETDKDAPPYALASAIYGPSYLSFEYALAWYGLIPERVDVYTSAVFRKNKIKTYQTPFGTFIYRTIPETVFPCDVTILEGGSYSWQMATPEKALCDMLYKSQPVQTVAQLRTLLFISWRMEPENVLSLNRKDVDFLAPRYRKRNLMLFLKLLEEGEKS